MRTFFSILSLVLLIASAPTLAWVHAGVGYLMLLVAFFIRADIHQRIGMEDLRKIRTLIDDRAVCQGRLLTYGDSVWVMNQVYEHAKRDKLPESLVNWAKELKEKAEARQKDEWTRPLDVVAPPKEDN